MRFRSSGFGDDRELIGHMSDLSPMGDDLLVFHIQTTEPVKWHLRAGMQFSDIPAILKGMLKPSILFLVLRSLLYLKASPKKADKF